MGARFIRGMAIAKARPTRRKMLAFWREHAAGRRRSQTRRDHPREYELDAKGFMRRVRWFGQQGYKRREPEWYDHHTLGVVRQYDSKGDLDSELQRISRMNQMAKKSPFKHFALYPIEILGVHRATLRLVERVHRAPNVAELVAIESWEELPYRHLYGIEFIRRMRSKGIALHDLQEKVRVAFDELRDFVNEKKLPLDFRATNLLVVDYDVRTQKPVIQIIDVGHSKLVDH